MLHSSDQKIKKLISEIRLHDHIALMYSAPEEKMTVLVPFVMAGLERGEPCFYIGSDEDIAALDAALRQEETDPDQARSSGLLLTVPAEDFPVPGPLSGTAPVIERLETAAAEARAAGFPLLRLCDEKVWVLKHGLSNETLIEYEARMNDLTRGNDIIGLCIYDLTLFPPETIRDVIRTHPKVVISGIMCSNFSYLPPEEFFDEERADFEVRHLLQGMLSNEAKIGNLQTQKNLFGAVFDNLPEGVYVKDLQGRYLLINKAGAEFFGKTVAEVLGRTVHDLLAPQWANLIQTADRRARQAQGLLSDEITFEAAGVTRTILAIKGVFRSSNGAPTGIFGISRDITEQRRMERELADYQEQLRFMASELSLNEERQRRQIASVLHDQIGQTLALAKIRIEAVKRVVEGVKGGQRLSVDLAGIGELLDRVIQHSRSLTDQLSPPVLYELGLEAAVEALADEFQRQHGIEITFYDDAADKPLDDDLRGLLYQSVRELLVNIVKHAHASRATVSLQREGKFLTINVVDDGDGFDEKEKIRVGTGAGFGLFRMRERLKHSGGRFRIETAPGLGTRVIIAAPVNQ
ncbi:MEDS domain-containing protein [Geomesophilobacter sediminis]|uniref:Oxygen sensor histidine kinase NreB n=1 Tax=Geomesophilobacter sediminis TaxID=2798584 RepID=A0A8J7LUC8_9BACT|nr:MEDS domain-containing protein [Geomesophilobacter sediminis]MBJ6724499.1 MEDS domain-containing protein [Geomesophilobacter sediminis]